VSHNWEIQLRELLTGDFHTLARCISLVENEVKNSEELLKALPMSATPVIGITGPPGAGKSTLADALIGELLRQQKKIAVLCVDPSSPFSQGSLLGDRIRMSEWYNNPNVFIRSLASRGSLGGLNPKIIEITDLLRAAPFDYILVETVGVGQNEVEIAGLADITLLVLVPESGDEIQTMKAGLLEIADIFVVNKSDRPDAARFVQSLRSMLPANAGKSGIEIPIVQTVATQRQGLPELAEKIMRLEQLEKSGHKKDLLTEKAYQLIVRRRMKDISKPELARQIREQQEQGLFNLYRFISSF
jgi:LAO/AO transport system kinase